MEVDISTFFASAEPFEFSASKAERGETAGPDTWRNAMQEAATTPLLTTDKQLQALRDHVQASGFGDEVQGYGADECNALFIQLVSGDMREAGLDGGPSEQDWKKYEADENARGSLYRGDDGRIYYYLGS